MICWARARGRGGRGVARLVAVTFGAVLLAGCGSSTLTAGELRTRATRLCTTAVLRSNEIALPASTSGGAAFLAHGITIFRPELAALRKLAPPRSLAEPYRVALADAAQQLDALVATDHNLRNGDDPVVAIRQLNLELVPIDARDTASWRAVGVPGCANLGVGAG
jgi:hypothetical protein